ncbi:hypothetical protein P5V15_004272 [Pogonomyrmex californicus]
MDIIIDTKGDSDLTNKNQLDDDDIDDVKTNTIGVDSTKIFNIDYLDMKEKKQLKRKSVFSKDFDLDKFETDMGWKSTNMIFEPVKISAHTKEEVDPLSRILEKSIIKSNFEQLHVIPSYELSKHQLEKHKRREKQNLGMDARWFNMRAPEITPEIKHNLEVIRMRSTLDPKHFYKKNDMEALPKYFHVGKVIDSPIDFYSSRLTKKEHKKTIIDELMADAAFTKYNKRKYKEIIEENQKTHYKVHKRTRRLKTKKRL